MLIVGFGADLSDLGPPGAVGLRYDFFVLFKSNAGDMRRCVLTMIKQSGGYRNTSELMNVGTARYTSVPRNQNLGRLINACVP
jgi:hypothetical protein